MSQAVERILSNYAGENPGVIGNLRRLMNTGTLAGTGSLVILPVDQGFEHGPARSFAPNVEGYDPSYHPKLAIEAGCNAYAAPLGFMEAVAHEYAGKLPLILKVNNSDSLGGPDQPYSAVTSAVNDALRLGCTAIGFTIYPGSSYRNDMYGEIRDMMSEAREVGLPTVMWSYPRGATMSKSGETALDVVAYAAHIACQLGAHIVKVKLPTDHIEQDAAKKSYEGVEKATLADRVRHVMKASFNGKRIVIFSGGVSKGTDEVLEEIRAIKAGGGNGSIMGRNSFQRSKADGTKLLQDVIKIMKG
ncbi:MAG: class I fructose-bisphosphate aldolase [Sandaracinaceae bacterium]|nr:class I fructose-bisphosphate aldolase [Sandaracinaceae bacterium]